MQILKILGFILNHPLNNSGRLKAIFRFLKWQLNSRLTKFPIVYPFTEHSKLIIWKGLTGATGNIYTGLMEYEDMGFLLHILREEDLFLDVGANIGSYTILASAEVRSRSISIEPVPSTFSNLEDNLALNRISVRTKALNIGLANKKGIISFTKSLDTTNHVATPGEVDVIDVQVDTLDEICKNECPVLIKIDVEGFEQEVLEGAKEVLSNKLLKAIIIELNGSGKRYGYDDENIHRVLTDYGFSPFNYQPLKRDLEVISTYGKSGNTIYIRDYDFVADRIKTARAIKIGPQRAEL